LDKFTALSGIAAPMPLVNIDADMISPKRYLKTIKRTGMGVAMFDEMRWNRTSQKTDFVLNRPQ